MSETPNNVASKRPRNYVLVIMVAIPVILIAIVVFLNVYNARDVLTRERLEAARQLWRAAGIKNYDVTVTVTGNTSGVYDLKVRDGEVKEARQNGQPFEGAQRAYWTIDSIFDVVLVDDLANDAREGSPTSRTRVRFDPTDGHPVRYVRSAQNQNVSFAVDLRRR